MCLGRVRVFGGGWEGREPDPLYRDAGLARCRLTVTRLASVSGLLASFSKASSSWLSASSQRPIRMLHTALPLSSLTCHGAPKGTPEHTQQVRAQWCQKAAKHWTHDERRRGGNRLRAHRPVVLFAQLLVDVRCILHLGATLQHRAQLLRQSAASSALPLRATS